MLVNLTTVNQHFHQIGMQAAALIVDLMEDSDREPQQIVLPVEMVVGQSTAIPRQL